MLLFMKGFLINVLPRKVGYFKFILILVGYIIFFGWTVYLLGEGYIGLFAFFMMPIVIEWIGVYFLREEFIYWVEKDFRLKIKNSSKSSNILN